MEKARLVEVDRSAGPEQLGVIRPLRQVNQRMVRPAGQQEMNLSAAENRNL